VREGLFGDSSSAKLVLTILAAVAELERDLISERTRVGLQAAKDSGKRLGRPEKEIPIADLQAIADGIYFKDRGIRLLIVRDGLVGDGSSAKLVLTILAAVAELERDLISERTRVLPFR